MDFREMVKTHRQSKADVTISALPIDDSQAAISVRDVGMGAEGHHARRTRGGGCGLRWDLRRCFSRGGGNSRSRWSGAG